MNASMNSDAFKARVLKAIQEAKEEAELQARLAEKARLEAELLAKEKAR